MSTPQFIPASTGTAFSLKAHQSLRITNTHGFQVVDFWALSTSSPTQYLSMSHTHATLRKLTPTVGDTLYTSTSHPMLSWTQDTTKGAHDTLIAACNPLRYERMGVEGWHASCEGNYSTAIARLDLVNEYPKTAPQPLNLFMNVNVNADGKIIFDKPTSQKGYSVVFEALMDVIVVLSACPMDQEASEDWWPNPCEVEYEILN